MEALKERVYNIGRKGPKGLALRLGRRRESWRDERYDPRLITLLKAAFRLNCMVAFSTELTGVDGLAEPSVKNITLRSLPSELQTIILAHEIAHCVLHGGHDNWVPLLIPRLELEAEAVAYLVCKHMGLDCLKRSSYYIYYYVEGPYAFRGLNLILGSSKHESVRWLDGYESRIMFATESILHAAGIEVTCGV